MNFSNRCVEFVKQWETLVLEAMLPTKDDVWTIGYGHTRGVRPDDKCNAADAEKWLRDDMAVAERDVLSRLKVQVTEDQFDALVSLTFNAGYTRTLLQKLNAGDVKGAADEFDRWVYQAGKALWGLCRRRAQEKLMFCGVDYTESDSESLAEKIWARIPPHKRHPRKK